MLKTVWLIRHAENSKDESLDFALTEHGRGSTSLLGKEIAKADNASPTLIFSSCIPRAVMTGEILRGSFQNAAKQAYHIPVPFLAAYDDKDLINTVSIISAVESESQTHGFPEPQSIVIIGHKSNDTLQLLAAILDPEGYATDYNIAEAERDGHEGLMQLADMSKAEIEARYPGSQRPRREFSYLEAMMFRFLPEKWEDFHLGCARYDRTLGI